MTTARAKAIPDALDALSLFAACAAQRTSSPQASTHHFSCLAPGAPPRPTALDEIGRHSLAHGGRLTTPLTLVVELTTDCARKCLFCVQASGHSLGQRPLKHFDSRRLEWLVSRLPGWGIAAVELTGGEPARHPDFIRAVKMCKNAGLALVLETDGSGLRRDIIRQLTQLLDPWDTVLFSLDAASADTQQLIRGDASFDATRKRLTALGKAPFRLETRTVIVRPNLGEAQRIQKLALAAGATRSDFCMPKKHPSLSTDLFVSEAEFIALGASLVGARPGGPPASACSAGRMRCYLDVDGQLTVCPLAADSGVVAGRLFGSAPDETWDRLRKVLGVGAPCPATTLQEVLQEGHALT